MLNLGSSNTSPDARRSSLLPSAANASMMLVLLVVVALVALPASQTPPPAIAELSPHPQEQITEEQPEQATSVGEGEGGEGRGDGAVSTTTTTTTTTTTPPEVTGPTTTMRDPGRLRSCVSGRQTEDPHSPPCVDYWQGDNGGATSPGVTATEIRIACASHCEYVRAMLPHFNTRFEFYGRKLVTTETGGDACDVGIGFADDVEELVASADKAINECGAFASNSAGDKAGREEVYYDRLTQAGVVSVRGYMPVVDEAFLAANHPYQWSYLPTFDHASRNKAEWICSALRGRPPEFAGVPQNGADTRKFALVYTTFDGIEPNLEPMKQVLAGCGIDLTGLVFPFALQDDNESAEQATASDVVSQLKNNGVTSVICECHTKASGYLMSNQADAQLYNPEWLVSTYIFQTSDDHVRYYNSPQVNRTFGLEWQNKQLPRDQSPWWWAAKDADPNYQYPSEPYYGPMQQAWGSISLLAAGIQLAGPDLTPETFAQGLQAAQWPNPGRGQAPYWQADVGFGSSHSFIKDAALVWGSKSQASSWGNLPGAMCYAREGVRYGFGEWPSDNAGLYEGSCY